MITIPLQLPNDLARRVLPLQNRLPEIIELGLRQIVTEKEADDDHLTARQQALDALASTGIVTLPAPRSASGRKARGRRTPIKAGGPPASEMMIAERR